MARRITSTTRLELRHNGLSMTSHPWGVPSAGIVSVLAAGGGVEIARHIAARVRAAPDLVQPVSVASRGIAPGEAQRHASLACDGDLARFGLLILNKGNWNGRQLVSPKWIQNATTPSAHGPDYGYLWWLNRQKKEWPSAPRSSFARPWERHQHYLD